MQRIPDCLSARPFYTKYTQRVFEGFARLVFRYYCPLEVTGRGNLPEGPFIFCSNHASHMDSIALMTASASRFDRFGLLAASDYFFRNPVVYRCFSSMVNLIPISRTPSAESLHQTLATCRQFIESQGRHLIVFPEGTRSKNGEIGPFKPGVGLLSLKLGLPIVPAFIQGTRDAMPKGRFLPSHRPLSIRIGAPIFPDVDGNGAGSRKYDWIATEARRRIDEMREHARE